MKNLFALKLKFDSARIVHLLIKVNFSSLAGFSYVYKLNMWKDT